MAARIAIFLEANSRLGTILDGNPRLVSYIRSLELRNFAVWVACKEDLVAYEPIRNSTAEIVLRLFNVEELSLQHMAWNTLAPVLRAALAKVLKAPTLTRISLELFAVDNLSTLISLLSDAVYLKVLKLNRIDLEDRTLFGNFIIPESDPNLVPPRSIKLSQLSITFIPDLSDWFQHESCLFEVRHLHSG